MVSVTLDLSQYEDISKLTKDAQRTGMQKTGQFMISQLMMRSPVDHGLLRQWAAVSQSESEIVIQSPAFYAAYQNYGTRPYDIYPKGQGLFHAGRQLTKGSALWWPGARHPVRHVKHPGLRPKRFVENSIQATQARIGEFFSIKG